MFEFEIAKYLTLSQGVGLVAFVIGLWGYLGASDARLKYTIGTASLIMGAHFVMLGAWAGGCALLLSAVRSFAASQKWGRQLAPLFFMAYVPLAWFLVKGPVDVLPVMSGVIVTYAMFYSGGIRFRVLMQISIIFWVWHDVYYESIGATLLDSIMLFVNAFTIGRMWWGQRRQVKMGRVV